MKKGQTCNIWKKQNTQKVLPQIQTYKLKIKNNCFKLTGLEGKYTKVS